ncbi:MAG: GAF domain-containing protein, partial [Burkholderiales bacterium]
MVVEDLPTDAELMARELRRAEIAYSIRRVDSERDFVAQLEGFDPGVIISDYSLPDFSGRAALAIARERRPEIPFIFVSGSLGEETAIEALKNGATDYVLKSNLRRLGPSVKRAASESRERAARRRAERMREGQNRILELVAAGVPLAEVLNELMLSIERHSPAMLCSVLLLDEDGAHLHAGAAPSLAQAYNQAIDGVAIGPTVGSCGTATYWKKQVIVSDIATDPLWADYRDLAAAHGLRACWSTPITSDDGKVLGTFANYYREARAPTADDLQLIELGSRLAKIAIGRDRSAAAVSRANQRLALALEGSRRALFDWDVSAAKVYLSEQWGAIIGGEVQPTLVSYADLAALVHPDDRHEQKRRIRALLTGEVQFYRSEHRVRAASGAYRWIESHGKVVARDPGGRALRVAGTNADITEEIEGRQRVARLSRIRDVLSATNSAIVRLRERQELFEEICRIAVVKGGFSVARVVMFDETRRRLHIAATTDPQNDSLQGVVDDFNRDPDGARSLLATALRSGQPAVSNDMAIDERASGRAQLTREGSYAVAIFPLVVDGAVTGALNLRIQATNVFDEEEVRLLLDLTGNLSFALELIGKQERLNYLANYDPLTGLPNRTLFLEHLGHLVAAAKRSDRLGAVALMDVNRFRLINDSLGAQAGDSLLRQIAERLKQAAFERDTLARIGPNGFAVLFREVKNAEQLGRI